MMFVEGSALFVIGAAGSMSKFCREDSANYHAVVTTPYLVGGICYTVGSYAGVL